MFIVNKNTKFLIKIEYESKILGFPNNTSLTFPVFILRINIWLQVDSAK